MKHLSKSVFEQLYRDQFPDLCRLAFRVLGEEAIAEDLVQTTFLRIWEKADFDRIEQPVGYLKKAVINACRNHLDTYFSKHVIRMDHIEEPAVGIGPEPDDLSDLKHQLDQAIKRLPPKCQIIFALSRFEGMASDEIGQYLSLSKRTVENQIGIALRKLRQDLLSTKPESL